MARVQGMTPEGIRKAIAEAIAFIKDLNVEDLNKLLAAFEDANGIFDIRLVEAQEEVKKAGEKALEAGEQAERIVEELARYQELQDAETARILDEVAAAILAANLASDRIPTLMERLAATEEGLAFANSEFSTLILKQDEFLDTVSEQTSEVARIGSEFIAVNQTVTDAVERVDQSVVKVNEIGDDLELAKANFDVKIKKNQSDIDATREVASELQNEITTLTSNLGGLNEQHDTLASSFSSEVKNLKAADSSQAEDVATLSQDVTTKVGELRSITDTQSGEITTIKTTAAAAKAAADSAITNTVIQYAVGSSETVAPTTGWSSATPAKTPGSYIWMRTVITYGSGSTTTTSPAPVTGNTGQVGNTGAPGRGIQSTTYHYASSTSGTTAPTTGWVTTIPTVAAGSFLWTRKTERYTDGTQDLSYSTARQGINGAKGDPGAKGVDGLTSYLHVAYANNATGTSGFSTSDPTDRLYVGTYSDFIESDSTDPSLYAWQLVKGADGEDGNGVLSSTISYQSSTSATAQPTGTWLTTIPTVAAGSFLWTRNTTRFKDGSETVAYSIARQGSNGAAGLSVTSVTPYFQLVLRGATSPTKPTTATPSGWVSKEPDWIFGRELYRTEKVLYSNGTFTYTEVSKVSSYTAADKGISDAAAAAQALETYKTDNNVKVQKALGDAAKGISDASAANSIASEAAGKLPAMDTAISNAAAEAKKANEALPAIRTDISNVSIKLNTATGNITALENDVASKVDALQKMDQTQSGEISAANSKIDNLQISGRNLLKDSANLLITGSDHRPNVVTTQRDGVSRLEVVGGTHWNMHRFIHPNILDPDIFTNVGAQYVISADFRTYLQNSTAGLRVDVRAADGQVAERWETKISDTAGQWVRVSVPFSIPDIENLTNMLFQPLRTLGTPVPGDWVEVKNLKLERGNKATEWTPAPEDVDASVAKAFAEATTARAEADSKAAAAQAAAEKYAKEKSEADKAAAEATAAAEALRVAAAEANKAKTAASSDATAKANEAERLAKLYAEAQAKSAKEGAEATAAADAKAKADAAKIAAEGTAKTLADAAKSAADTALSSYKSANDPKVSKAQTDASKGISDAAAAKTQADIAVADAKAAADKLPDLTTGVANAAAEAKAANDALPKIRTDISLAKSQADKGVVDAANAQSVAIDARERSRTLVQQGDNLIPNGFGELGSNKYFENYQYIADDSPNGAYGSFQIGEAPYRSGSAFGEVVSIDTSKPLTASLWARKLDADQRIYFALEPLDADGNMIGTTHYMEHGGTRTQLAQPLRKGDMEVHLVDADESSWTAAETSNRHLAIWNYVDSKGKKWAPGTYTRNVRRLAWDIGGFSGNTITLNSPWNGAEADAGDWVSRSRDGSTYLYPFNTLVTHTEWGYYEGAVKNFPAATVAIRPRILLTPTVDVVRVAGLSLTYTKTLFNDLQGVNSSVAAAQATADTARIEAVNKAEAARLTAELYAKEQAEAAQARAETEAAKKALELAIAEANKARDAAAVDAGEKSAAAEQAAKIYAEAQAKTARESAEATAALDAKNKADKARTDAEAKAKLLADAAQEVAKSVGSDLTGYKTTNDAAVEAAKKVADKAADAHLVQDTRSVDEPPSWYWTNYKRTTVKELKSLSALGLSGAYGTLTTIVPWHDSSGGSIRQELVSNASGAVWVRRSSGTGTSSVWTPWVNELADLNTLAQKGVTEAAKANNEIAKIPAQLTSIQTAMDGRFTSANTSIEEAKRLANEAKTDLNNLEIGGRNLAQNSAIIVDNLGSTPGSRREHTSFSVGNVYDDMESETPLTISFDLEMVFNHDTTRTLQVYNSNSKGKVGFNMRALTFGEVATGETIKRRVSVTTKSFRHAEPNQTTNHIEFYSVYNTSNWFKITNLKIERGNIATDWTPAPEDTKKTTDDLQNDVLAIHNDLWADQGEFNQMLTTFTDNQTGWNAKMQEFTTLQGKINTNSAAFQDFQIDINSKRDRWESGATLAIDHLTNFTTEQAKWNKASSDATTALTNASEAQTAINTANAEFQAYQTDVNARRDVWEKASTDATKALGDLAVEQGKVLTIQNELQAKRDKWESGATLAIDNLTDFATKQTKWNTASTEATTALSNSSKAQIDATKAIAQILNMVYPNNSLVPMDPDTNLPMWTKGYSKNTDGNWLVTGAAKIIPSNTSPHVAVQTGQIYRAVVRLRTSNGTPSFSIRLRTRGSESSITPTYVAIPAAEVPTGMVVKNWLGSSNLATSTAWQEWVCDFRLPDNIENVRVGYVYSTTSTAVEVSRFEIFPLLPSQKQIDDIQDKTLRSHTALFEGQNKWNDVASAAIASQATLLAKQDTWNDGVNKALAWQSQLNDSQSDINRTTKSVLDNQDKWNTAQEKVNDAQSEINQAVKLVQDNQSKWNTAQEKVNNTQSELNQAVKLVQDKQADWNEGVTKALASHDELFKNTSTTFKAVKAVNDNQDKWNKVVSDLVTTNSAVGSANKTAIEGLTRVLGLTQTTSNVVPMVPGGVRTGGTDIAPIFKPTPVWMTKGPRVTVTDIPGMTSIDAIRQTGNVTHLFDAYYSEVNPTIEYRYSYWAKADVESTRIYIDLGSKETSGTPILVNTPDNHTTTNSYLAGNVMLTVGWKQYTGTIRFKPEVRSLTVKGVYYSHILGASGTQTLADIQIYPNIPSQADVNKALLDSDAAQNTLLAKQDEWNGAVSRSIATVESLWGKTETQVGELNVLSEELGKKITSQGDEFSASLSQLFTYVPRIAYAEDGKNVASSETDGFIKITRTKSGNQTTRVTVEAVGKWVGSMIVEGDHGQSNGTNQTFMNYTPIRVKRDILTGTREFYLNRNTNVDHIGAVKVTFFVQPGEVKAIYPNGGTVYPDKGEWKVLASETAPETTEYNVSLNVTWAATTYDDDYGIRIRVGTNTVAIIQKNRVGPLLPGQGGVRTMTLNKSQVKVPAGTKISLEAYSTAGSSLQRRIASWYGQISYITSGRG